MGLGLGLETGRRREGGEGVREHQRRRRWRAVGRRRWEEAPRRRRATGKATGTESKKSPSTAGTKTRETRRSNWGRRPGRYAVHEIRFCGMGARADNGSVHFPCHAGPKHVGRIWRPSPARGSGRAGPGTILTEPCRAWAGQKTCWAAG
jgi:hypothetical protein